MEKVEVVFFDLFLTLVIPKYNAIEEENEYYKLGVSKEKWEEISEDKELYDRRGSGLVDTPRKIIEEIVEKFNINISEEELKEIVGTRKERFSRCLLEVEGKVLEVLEELSQSNMRMCLISNADVIDKLAWNKSPLYKYFEEAIFSCDVGILKPNIDIYKLALERMGIESKKSIFIGDGGSDELRGAKGIGMRTILVTHYLEEKDERIKKVGEDADCIIGDFRSIKELMITNKYIE